MKKMMLSVAFICIVMHAMAFRIAYGGNVSITKPEYGDLYIAAGTITINAPVYGDLIIAGGTVIINDSVMNDILLVAGNATFNGYTADDIRCAGGELYIKRDVAGDLVCSGGTVTVAAGVSVGGLLAGGGTVIIDGTVNGTVICASGNFTLNGTAAKNIDCRGESIRINGTVGGGSVLAAPYIRIGNNASFGNGVRYWNKKGEVDFRQSVKNGKAVYDPSLRIESNRWYYLGTSTMMGLLWYTGTALLMIIIIQYLFSATMKKAADTVFQQTAKSLLYGLLYIIAIPVIIVVAFISLIGLPAGILLLFGYIFSLLLITIIAAVIASNWINNRNNYQWRYWQLVFTAFGLFLLFKLISLMPFAGWVIMFAVSCICIGAILLNVHWKRKTVVQALPGHQ